MYIILGEPAEILQNEYTVLELETFEQDGKATTAYCVVPQEKILLTELPTLAADKQLHQFFIDKFKANQYNECRLLIPQLMGKFGGELDSFYEIIAARLAQ